MSGEKKIAEIERIGVSLDKKLLSMFDKLIAGQGYKSRSEAIRDLVRRQLSEERLENPKATGDFLRVGPCIWQAHLCHPRQRAS